MSEKDERDEVISMIRACLLSFKGEVSLKNLDTDYSTMVGKHIPYKALGYSSLLSFIESVEEIHTIKDYRGETMLTAAATSSSKHIAKMVAKQKNPKKFAPRFSTLAFGDTKRENDFKDGNNRITSTGNYEVPPRFKTGTATPSPTGSVWDNEEPIPVPPEESQDIEKGSVKGILTTQEKPVAAIAKVPKANTQECPTSPAVVKKKSPVGMMGVTPIQLRLQAYKNQFQAIAQYNVRGAFLYDDSPDVPPYLGAGAATTDGGNETNAAQSEATFPNSHLLGPTFCLLKRYCCLRGLPPPEVVIESHATGLGYIGTLSVGIFSFASTFPDGVTARACVENMSVEAHHILVKLNLPIEIDYENPQHQINRILKIIYQYEMGIWSTYVEKMYTDFYKEVLPTNWIDMIFDATDNLAVDKVAKTTSHDSILKPKILSSVQRLAAMMYTGPILAAASTGNLIRPIGNVPINTYSHMLPVRPMFRQPVYNPSAMVMSPVNEFNPFASGRPRARTSTTSQPASPTDLPATPVSPIGVFITERPVFPKGSVWDIVVTNVFATDEVWVRLASQESITIYHDMCNNMDIHYLTYINPPEPVVPIVGSCYAIQIESCWQRVKLLDIKGNGDANLFFIDQGDEEIYPFSLCRILHPSFAKVPAQAIHLVLAGLEEFGNDASHTGILIDVLLGKTLVANIYMQLKDRTVVMLYNTDSATDININSVLTERMSLECKPPKLPSEGQAQEVYLSHIDRDGTIFVVVDCDSFKFLHLMILQIRDQPEKIERCKVANDTSRLKIYLARLTKDDEFYRVIPLTQAHNGKVPVRFIDHGHTDTLDISCMYDLSELSDALARLPPQGIKVTLHNLPKSSFTHRMAERLRELIPEDLLVLLKVIKQAESGGTEVEIFKRIQPDNMLVSVNNTLALDPELKRTTSPEPQSAFAAVRPRRRSHLVTLPSPAPTVDDIRDLLEALESGELDDALTNVSEEQFPPSPRRQLNAPCVPPAASKTAVTARKKARALPPAPAAESNETSNLPVTVKSAVVTADGAAEVLLAPYQMSGLPPPIIPPVGSLFDVHIPIVSNPHNFFVQPWTDAGCLEQMMYQMQAVYGGINPASMERSVNPEDIFIGCSYAGLHSDGNWYRVTARSTAQGMTVLVSFSDFGDLSVLHLTNMRFLEDAFKNLSCQGINAKLWGIKPSHQDWAVIDCIHFQKLVGDRDFVSVVMEKSHAPDNPDEIIIGLRLIDTSGETDVYVDQLLVDEQKAVFTHDMLKEGCKTTADIIKG